MVWAKPDSGAAARPANNSHARLMVVLPDNFQAVSADMAEQLDRDER
jgi:hypothetical protein